jgi:polyhydroxyalkanoate depolymerase
MPNTINTLAPTLATSMKSVRSSLDLSADMVSLGNRWSLLWLDSLNAASNIGMEMWRFLITGLPVERHVSVMADSLEGMERGMARAMADVLSMPAKRFERKRHGESEFLKLFCEAPPCQCFNETGTVLVDLPGMRLIDISKEVRHDIGNYTVVFAPRAGHHSNIAERVALYMRDTGLTRMAIVEQKCAQEIPLYVDGRRHHEGFDGQVEQYRTILETLKEKTGHPAHLVAVCQPGPLLMSTLILHPHLGKTFGSAGAPMNTDAERGFLSDFARTMGEHYIDILTRALGSRVPQGLPGEGRDIYDGRLQVLGFYILGMPQHYDNLKKLLMDLRDGNEETASRQMAFYQWYNYSHDFPASFLRDTFKKVFVRNELVRGSLTIQGKQIGVKDYPSSVPIWALGGTQDNIAPCGQAIGHVELIEGVAQEDRLVLCCDAGHMGLFRSGKVLDNYYSLITRFLLEHSDR